MPVIKTHGPLEGIVSRGELVEVQNARLDEFHLKESITKMSDDLDQGKLIGSMNLAGNIHATRFKKFLANPVAATKQYLAADDKPVEEDTEFYLDAQDRPSANPAGPNAAASGPLPGDDDSKHAGGLTGRASHRGVGQPEQQLQLQQQQQQRDEEEVVAGDAERQPLTGGGLHSSSGPKGPGRV